MARNENAIVTHEQADVDQNRELIVERLIPSVPEELTAAIGNLIPVKPGYKWFSEDNLGHANECLKALISALSWEHKEVVDFFAGAIIDLYHKDRADRASSLVEPNEEPIRGITPKLSKGIIRHTGTAYDLQQKELAQWDIEIPFDGLSLIALVGYEATPDIFCMANYESKETKEESTLAIYAKYGDWYTKVVEWE